MTNSQKQKQIKAMFGAYSKRLEKLYDQFIGRLTNLANRVGIDVEDFLKKDGLFRFDKYPELRQEYNEIFKDYVQKEVLAYRAGITDGVALAYAHDASVLSGFSVLSNKAITHARNVAAETFIRNRMNVPKGLNLSQLIWNYASQTKSEFEVAVSNVIADGLKKGTSAESLGRSVRQYLNNPDMMYRRYHRTILDAYGNKSDMVTWRRRIVDNNGRVRFVEEPLEKVGTGHYRSSRKNANRLMRTEINTAYHKANVERWQLEPFVIGIMIELSPQHPEYDECDELKGRYPKDFIFTGWHPQCLCMSNPITIQGDEKKEFYRRLAAGEDMSDYVSPNAVEDIPGRAKNWIDAHKKQFIRASQRGKLGYVWQDNMKYVSKQFTKKELEKMGYGESVPSKHIKTEEEKVAIQRRWDERRARNILPELEGVSKEQIDALLADPSPSSPSFKETEKAISHSVFNYVGFYKGRWAPVAETLNKLNAEKDGYKRIKLINELKYHCSTVAKFDLEKQGIVNSKLFYSGLERNYTLQEKATYYPLGQRVDIPEKKYDLVKWKDKFGKEYLYPLGTNPYPTTYEGVKYNVVYSASKASEYVEQMPNYLRKNFKGMFFCSEQHPIDAYYAIRYQMPGFRGAMYGGQRIFINDGYDFKFNIVHEIGHNIDHKLGIAKEWERVIFDDDFKYIREYSKKAIGEDIADSWALWFTNRDKLRREFPSRYEAIKKLTRLANR